MYQKRPGLKLSLKLSAAAIMAVGGLLMFGVFSPQASHAAAGINQQLSFQGRLLDNTGAVVADGSYNMEFKIYQDGTGCVAGGTSPCGGTLKWTEDWIQTNRVTVKNGYFSVNLGSLTAFGTNIDWNQDTLWLSTNIGGVTNTPTPTWDGEMLPFKRITASPYSLNSNALQGLQASSFVQLANGLQADTSATNPSIFINKNNSTGTPDILELQKAGADVLTIANDGSLTSTPSAATATISLGSTAQSGTITLGQFNGASTSIINIGDNAGASTTQQVNIGTSTLGISTVAIGSASSSSTTDISSGSGGINLNPSGVSNTGVAITPTNNSTAAFKIQSATAADTLLTADTTNNKLVVGNATGTNASTTQLIVDSSTADPSVGFNGAIYYNSTSNKFRCYQGGAWADCLAASGNGIATYTGAIINQAATATATAVQAETFTAAGTFTVTSAVSTFTAPAAGSFRACQVIGDANTTAGTASLRWRVNGVSVGSAACVISTANNHVSTTALDDGVVTFSAGDTIGVVMDSAGLTPAASTDFTIMWSVEYNSVNTAPSGATLQSAYNNNSILTTTDANDLVFNAADTATDSNLLFNLQCVTTCTTNGRFAVQNAGADVFTVSPNSGNITLAPAGAGDVVMTGDNDSNVAINSTFTGTGPTQNGLGVTLTDNATAAGTSYGLNVTNADNGANTGTPAALAHLNNANAADTVPDGLSIEQTGAGTLTNGLEIKRTAGTIANGLTFTGTFGTNLINAGSALTVTAAGAATLGSNLTVNGTTVELGNGAAATITTPSGNANLTVAPNGTGQLNLATTNTGLVNIGNSTGTFQLTSNGGLNVSTTGGLTGVSSLDTIGASATGLTFANAGTIASTGANGLTLQAGNGAVSLGTSTSLINTGASLTVSSSGGSDVALANNVILRPGVDSNSGVVIQNAGGVSNLASFGTNTSNPNLVANPSLENNANGWVKKGNTGVAATSSDDFAQYGSRSLKIVTTATIGDGASYTVPLKASTQYTLSGWIRLSTGTATTINLNRQDNGADIDGGTGNCVGISVTVTFTQFTCTFTTGATVNGTTNIYVKQTDATVRTMYVDGVTLVAAATGLTYDAGGSGISVQSLGSQISLNAGNSGDVQSWRQSATPLTTALRYSGSITANGYVYVIGGCTTTCAATTQVSTVYYSKLNADGSMGTWSTANALPAGRYGLTALYANGYVYAIGGDSGAGAFGATPQNTVYYAKTNNDGTVGTWQTSVNTLTAAREFQTSTFVNGFIYVIGGDNAGAQSTVYYSKSFADGSIGSWSATTAMTTGAAARRYASTIVANGFMYVIGGDTGGTAQSTVYYDSINGDGTLGATWASTTPIAVGGTQNRRHQTSVVLNGYVYVIGGDNGTTAQNTVYYAKLLPDGTIGTWQATSSTLPAGRYGMGTLAVNGYIYAIGGYDGTNTVATPYYASTERTLIGGSLDLVGLSGQSLSDSGGAGSITAGSIRAVGGLTVDGFADFNNGASIDSSLSVNAVSANAGQTVFNINNLNSNSIFSVRHMNTNFGALATTGAFMSKNSYFGEEYNVGHNGACTVNNTTVARVQEYARGDGGNAGSATLCSGTANTLIGGGELNFSSLTGATAGSCQAASPGLTTANGVESITAISTAVANNKALCAENIAGNLTQSSKIYTSTNLPVVEMKVKPTTTVGSNNTVIVAGMSGDDAAAAANVLPTTGIFFTNCSTYSATAPSGCSNTTWYGMASGGSAQIGTTQTCSAAMTANFAYLRIEVRATNDVHFFVDANTTDGITETECGTGITTTVNAGAMSMWVAAEAPTTAAAATTVLQIDYFRSWQDDNTALTDDTGTSVTDDTAAATDLLSAPPLTPLNTTPDGTAADDQTNPFSTLTDFEAATSEDTVFNNNIYVQGTIYANKIVANQIEGMDVITDEIDSLSEKLAKQKIPAGTSSSTPSATSSIKALSIAAGSSSALLSLNNVQAVNLTVLQQLEAKGGLVVDGNATFNGSAQFKGQVSFNSDAGGTAVIKQGATSVKIKFSKSYQGTPIITANYLFTNSDSSVDQANLEDLTTNGVNFIVTQTTTKGFTIMLNKASDEDINFSWLATQIDSPQNSQSDAVSISSGN